MNRPVDRFRTDFVRLGDDEPKFAHRYPDLDQAPPRPVFIADIRGIDAVRAAFEELWAYFKPDLLDAFMAAVTSLPHKLGHFAAVLAALAASPFVPMGDPFAHQNGANGDKDAMDEDSSVQQNVGRVIIDHLVAQLVILVERQQWRSTRLVLHLFAHLASLPIPLVDCQSLAATLGALATALEPENKTTGYEDDIARAIIECYARVEGDYRNLPDFEPVVDAVKAYAARRKIDRDFLLSSHVSSEHYFDVREMVSPTADAASPSA